MSLRTSLLAAAAALALSAPAFAAPISAGSNLSIAGNDIAVPGGVTLNLATGLDFTAGSGPTPGVAGVITSASGTGTFASLGACIATCGFIKDIPDFSAFAGATAEYTLTGSGLSFDLNAPLTITRIAPSASQLATLVIGGTGTFHLAGFDATPGVFTLTTQGAAVTTFSASTIAGEVSSVPEPMSLALLGTSLAGLGLIRRRKS